VNQVPGRPWGEEPGYEAVGGPLPWNNHPVSGAILPPGWYRRGNYYMRHLKLLGAALASVVALASTPAWADGTTAGVSVSNTATLAYNSGGQAQPGVTSNAATFTVDRKISMTLTEIGNTATIVNGAGTPNQATRFLLTNTSNAPLDFALAAANLVGGAGPINGTDSFDVSNFRFYIDNPTTGTVGSFDAGDALVTYIDELPVDAARTIFVVADIPAGVPNGGVAAISLTATAAEGGTANTQGAAVTQTAGAGNLNGVADTVFADINGTDDAARDGKISARDQYNVVAAALALVKSVTIISDPQNGTANPKAIPGAVLEYCLVAQNTGGFEATGVVISDPIPAQVIYTAGTGFANGNAVGTGATATCDTGAGAAGGVNTAVNPTASTASTFVTNGLTIPAGESRAARFRVTVR
jgi:uncharacterized repeat protein (TIGR01451 family)